MHVQVVSTFMAHESQNSVPAQTAPSVEPVQVRWSKAGELGQFGENTIPASEATALSLIAASVESGRSEVHDVSNEISTRASRINEMFFMMNRRIAPRCPAQFNLALVDATTGLTLGKSETFTVAE